jgi:hypothetical protein
MSKTIDPDTFDVYAYDTGEELEGLPTAELVLESLSAGDSGAVNATYDSDQAQWQYIAAADVEAAKQREEHVRTVFVQEA